MTRSPLVRSRRALLDVLPVKQHASTEYAYLRQTVRTNNAAVVAEGATKPTSVYSVTRIEDALVVVAHLSEGIPRFWLLDNSALETFVENELQYGLQVAVEAKVLADVNATAGSRRRRTHQRADHAAQGPDQAGDGRLHRQQHRSSPIRSTSIRKGFDDAWRCEDRADPRAGRGDP